jgi:hypothetical protein
MPQGAHPSFHNAPAMVADEVKEGLLRLGIVHQKTLPYRHTMSGIN